MKPGRCVLLAGASGLVGGHLARQLAEPGRTLLMPLRRTHSRLQALPGAEAVSWPLPAVLPRLDMAVCALGTTRAVAGSAAAFRAVDLDAVLAVAQAAKAAGAKRFGLVSALGANPHSMVLYSRVKGEAEQAVEALGFEQLVIAQPSLLLGERAELDQAHRLGEALAQRLAPFYSWITPLRWRPIQASAVAQGLLAALETKGAGVHRVLSDELVQLAT
jgi:uncharacterized protein YbjT (DUF2867 family)